MTDYPIRAEIPLATTDLRADLAFFGKELGLRLDEIYPADNPGVAVFSGHGIRIRLTQGDAAPGCIRILTDDPAFAGGAKRLTAPGGTSVTIAALNPPLVLPPTEHAFVVRRLRDEAPWVIGRAGMLYRDLVPSRLGGAMIASHIRIPDGGPVPDMVHFHKVGFQLIFCLKGWVDVLYEDQGGPLRLTPGDCFIQPPEIRHRVLEASEGIEVLEIGVPADHVTEIDHEMTLPTPHLCPDRAWQGQRFVHNRAEGADWQPFRLPGFLARDTTIAENTSATASVQVVRPAAPVARAAAPGPIPTARHDADILFGFVSAGSLTLTAEGQPDHRLETGDAFVIPPGLETGWKDPSEDLELIEVALPGRFQTLLSASFV